MTKESESGGSGGGLLSPPRRLILVLPIILMSHDTVCIDWITGVPAAHNTRCASLDSGVIAK